MAAKRRGWGTLRVQRSGRVQASYVWVPQPLLSSMSQQVAAEALA